MANPTIDGYTIERQLGRGGFASVHLATEDATGRQVAIKVLFDHATSEDDLKRFERERVSLAALTPHPHIVEVYDYGETDNGHHFMVIEYVELGSLRDRINSGGAMHWDEVIDIGAAMASALDAAHRTGVLHRDLKPANILLGENGAKLTDFGIARLVGQSQVTAAQSLVGTLAYTPPEILHNQPFDGRGDIYQLGISLYEALLGRAPFKSGQADNKAMVIRRILENPAPPLAQFDVPQPLSDLLDEVLAKDPADRPQTAAELRRRLLAVKAELNGGPAAAVTQTLVQEDADEGEATINWPQAAEPPAARAASAPQPPVIALPVDVRPPETAEPVPPAARPYEDKTLVEPRPDGTSVLPPSSAPTIETTPPPRRRRGPVVVAVVALILLGVGSVFLVRELTSDNTDPGDTGDVIDDDPVDDPDGQDVLLPIEPTIVRVDQPAFTAPEGSVGLVFSAVANARGLTAVGGAGDGETTIDQHSEIFTMEPDGRWFHQDQFASADGAVNEQQRLRDIAVIDGIQLLAVGETDTGSTTDGVVWMGVTVRSMTPLTHESFTGAGDQRLVGAVGDAGRQEFLIVGRKRGPSGSIPALWTLSASPTDEWDDPIFTEVPIGGDVRGTMTDVAVAGDFATAVGYETEDGESTGIILIRRDNVWQPLLEPIAGAELNAVDFFGNRIVAVGTRAVEGVSVPIAVVSDIDGAGWIHNLPVGDVSGRAIDVVSSDAGVFAVGVTGERSGESAFSTGETDGALWTLLPDESDTAKDRWITRDTDELSVEGRQEFWTVVEFDGRVFAMGRADNADGGSSAATWTVTVSTGDEPVDDEVEEAQADAAPDEPIDESAGGDGDLGVAVGGCAAQAVADVGAVLDIVAAEATEEFALWICSDSEGQLYYHGAEREGDGFITLSAIEVAGGYEAQNTGGTTYRIVDGRLTVRQPNGDVSVDQPLIGN
ncbi:MAG: serine/threonine protein kinase [Acidimicrobiales bacterium]|nr:MAG: serine/threonine protein kinase [Acidimicrobiales bacterium]